MLEDIKEQPNILKTLAEKFFSSENSQLHINLNEEQIKNISKIYIVASGSSKNAGTIAKYFIEKLTRIPTEADFASEFAHRDPVLKPNDVVILISQSGETADTFAALKIAKNMNVHTIAITNNPESKIHKVADSAIEVQAGKEISIAATKSFTAQLMILYGLSLHLAEIRQSCRNIQQIKQELLDMSGPLNTIIEKYEDKHSIAEKISQYKSLVIVGRNINYGTAQEGALKIKETSYIDANGYPSGEFLHGYVAVVDEEAPLVSIIMKDPDNIPNYRLAISNTESIKKKRNPELIIIKSESDKDIEDNLLFKGSKFINMPDCSEEVSPLCVTVYLQILAFNIARALQRDINNPRALTKAVTSE